MRSQLLGQLKGVDRANGLVVITAEGSVTNEIEAIERIYAGGGLWRLHLRKPAMEHDELMELAGRLSERIDPNIITIHHSIDIALSQGLGGVHGVMGSEAKLLTSISCHTMEEVRSASTADYMFLSPIFDSISKSGYGSRFDINALWLPTNRRVVALGGVDGSNIGMLSGRGFFSAALLGSVWGSGQFSAKECAERFNTIAQKWQQTL